MMESIVDPLKLVKGFRLWAKKGLSAWRIIKFLDDLINVKYILNVFKIKTIRRFWEKCI